jgi:hypothetical protein
MGKICIYLKCLAKEGIFKQISHPAMLVEKAHFERREKGLPFEQNKLIIHF